MRFSRAMWKSTHAQQGGNFKTAFLVSLRSIKNRQNTTSIPWTTRRTTEKFFPFFYIVFFIEI